MPYGLTNEGFVMKPLSVILDEIAAAQRASAALGADIDTSAESLLGQMNGVMATKLRELWELGGAAYNARNPRGAAYNALDIVCALTGVYRLPATKGTLDLLNLSLNAGVTVPAGSVVHVNGDPTNRWVTTIPGVNATGSPAVVGVYAEAETAGRFIANAGTLTQIATPVSGWTAATNPSDATPGRNLETDTALRQRRERVIRAGGSSPLDAIRAALFEVTDVAQVSVFENPTDTTVGGMPPHSVRAVVTGGTDLAVATALWGAKGGGIQTVGAVSQAVVDTQGVTHAVRFDRPTDVDVYVKVTIERDAARYAGDDAVKAAVVELEDALLAGDNVRLSVVSRAALSVAGVVDVVAVLLGRSAGAGRVAASLAIDRTERAQLDASRVEVVTQDVTS